MRRHKVDFRPSALADLVAIFEYIHETSGSAKTARRFVERNRARCDKVGYSPHTGRERDDLAKGLRTVPFERSAVIAYVIEDERVRITNVFYGGRNYEALYHGATDERPTTADPATSSSKDEKSIDGNEA